MRCSACKAAIEYQQIYWVCSVSTCTRKRTGMVFCSVSCWESHVPMMRHRESWAVEEKAPTKEAWERELAEEAAAAPPAATAAATPTMSARSGDDEGRRRVVATSSAPASADLTSVSRDTEADVLVVVSKLKKYIKERSGMNTSDTAIAVLSSLMRQLSDEAIRAAAQDGRKTVMDRDFRRRL